MKRSLPKVHLFLCSKSYLFITLLLLLFYFVFQYFYEPFNRQSHIYSGKDPLAVNGLYSSVIWPLDCLTAF